MISKLPTRKINFLHERTDGGLNGRHGETAFFEQEVHSM
jgi:hypothetical protein